MNKQIEQRLIRLVKSFNNRMPSSFLEETLSNVKSAEYGVALENLCVQIYEYNLDPSDDELKEIKQLTSSMQMDSSTWDFLQRSNR
jgi:hypothetical protein